MHAREQSPAQRELRAESALKWRGDGAEKEPWLVVSRNIWKPVSTCGRNRTGDGDNGQMIPAEYHSRVRVHAYSGSKSSYCIVSRK